MKITTLMIFAILFSLSSYSQKYSKVLNQKFTAGDLEYMPLEELRLLKNELIATKGSDVIRTTENSESPYSENSKPFLDETSQANLDLISKLETSLIEKDSVCAPLELYQRFVDSIKNRQTIPFYLQTLFFSYCQNPKANIYLIPASENYNTVAISEAPMIGPEHHYIITFSLDGKRIDTKSMNGKARFEENKIIHESYNSLIEYTYTIDTEGKFDKKTPTKKRNE